MDVPRPDEEESVSFQEVPVPDASLPTEDSSGSAAATFEERFEQFHLQLSQGKTGGMVVSFTYG